MTQRTRVPGLVTLILMLLMVAPTVFGAEANAERWLAGIEDVNGDAVPDIAVGDPTHGQMFIFSGADGTLLDTVEDPDVQAEASLTEVEDDLGDVIVGDVNGDTVPEIAVEASSGGQVLIFSGADGSVLYTLDLQSLQAHADVDPCGALTKYVKKGKGRTLEDCWNCKATAFFRAPPGAHIKVRYGVGWLGWDSQKQTLNGVDAKRLSIGKKSVAYARMQMKVPSSTHVTYTYCLGGSPEDLPEIPF